MSTTEPTGADDSAPTPAPQVAESSPGGARGGWLGALFVALVAVGMFWNTLDHQLVYDDWFLINPQNNQSMAPVIEDYSAIWSLFGQEYWEGVSVGGIEAFGARGQALYRPLTLAIWGTINWFQFHDNPIEAINRGTAESNRASARPHHAVNIAANAIACALLFLLLLRLFGNQLLALLGALLYTVHPLHSEAVAYVAGLSDILTAMAVFLGLLFWERFTRDPSRPRVGAFVGLVLTMFLGLLAKESAILLLPAVLVADLALSLNGRVISMGRRLAAYAGLLGVIGVNIAIRWQVLGRLTPDKSALSRIDNPLVHLDVFERLLNSFKLIAKYAWLTLWPEELSMDYSYNQIPVSESFSEPAVLSGFALILALLIVGLVRLRGRPALGFGLLLFLGTTAFFSNMLAAIGTIFAERLAYLPSAGAAIAIAAVLVALFSTKGRGIAALHPVGLVIALVMIGALGYRTTARNAEFRSAVVLFESALKVSPNSTRVHYQLGSIYQLQQLNKRAIAELERALQIDPLFFQARIRRAEILALDEQNELATQAYQEVIGALNPTNEDGSRNDEIFALLYRGLASVRQNMGDLDGAATALNRARDYGDMGSDENEVALVALLQGQKKWAESLSVIDDGLLEQPDSVRLLLARARAASQLGDLPTYQSALEGLDLTAEGAQLAELMRAEVQYDNAAIFRDDEALEEATATFERISKQRPDFSTPYVYRGKYLLDIADDAEAAIIEFDKALELNTRDSQALLYKVIALTRLERWEQALQALELLGTVNPDDAYLQMLGDVNFMLGNTEAFNAAYDELAARQPEGQAPVGPIVNRALGARKDGDPQAAVDQLERALLVSANAENVILLVTHGQILAEMGRFDEALLSYDRAEASFAAQPDIVYDEYLPTRRALCLMALGRDVEAAGALERVDLALQTLEWTPVRLDQLRVSLLHHRAMLHVRAGGTFHDLARVEELCREGIELTRSRGGNLPAFYDISIDAFIQQSDFAAAATRAREGEQAFVGTPHNAIYRLAAEALEARAAGDLAKALEQLGGSAQLLHKQLHRQLEKQG
ncbi:MAG: hypothetical protein DHS20C15_15660 [Planctomycetota bacterium]|nr:MAG: hypothetical protein DHS20C15_15660 [Planctomycetota bacterium]